MSLSVKLNKPDRIIEQQLRHTFNDKETLELARKLAEGNRDLAQAEDEKKSVTSQLKAKADAIQARVTEVSGKINCGFEYRPTKVTVKYHLPAPGLKRLIREDTGEIVEELPMTSAECQGDLALEPAKPESGGTVPVPADGGTADTAK